MLSPGTIVIVNTKDIGRGRVRCPAIIRYYDAGHDVYECNLLNIGQNPESCIALIDRWPIGENEIEEVCGQVVERPVEFPVTTSVGEIITATDFQALASHSDTVSIW